MKSVKLLQSWMFLIWAFAEKIPYFLRTNLKMLPYAENCPNIWHWPGLCWSGRPEVNVNTNLLSFKRESFIPLCAVCCTWIGPRSRINKQTDLLIKKSLFNLGTSEWESVRCWSHCKHRERGVSARQRVTDRRWIKVNAYLEPVTGKRWSKRWGWQNGPWQHQPLYVYMCLTISPKDTI